MKNITTKELFQKIQSKDDFQIIDVRSSDEWDAGHIDDSRVINIGVNSLMGNVDKIKNNVDIYLICASGGRSQVAQVLLKMKKISSINVSGGMNSWINNNFPFKRKD